MLKYQNDNGMHHHFTVRQTSAENGDESTMTENWLTRCELFKVTQTCFVMKLNFLHENLITKSSSF